MKKVKKSIFLLALLSFVSLTNSMESEFVAENIAFVDCVDEAFDAMDEMLDSGYSELQASCMGNAVYAACEGWNVSIQQAEECFE